MEYDRSRRLYSVWACVILLFSSTGLLHAELLGSPYPAIQENFNQLLTKNVCSGCDLRGVVMSRLNLSGANLEGANLTGAQLNFVCFAGANLRNADLHGAWLIGADLSEADLAGTILEDADLAQLWSKKARFRSDTNSAKKEKQDSSVPDLFGDWRKSIPPPESQAQSAPARRSVDDVPVLEITAISVLSPIG